MSPQRIRILVLVLLIAVSLVIWKTMQPPLMPSLPPGTNSRMQEDPADRKPGK